MPQDFNIRPGDLDGSEMSDDFNVAADSVQDY
jgi:hypothetical protein